jgi:diguanylate cyclase (GGDEF)-like protein/PAS domain S-box-containing protein
VGQPRAEPFLQAQLASIVQSSADGIISKTREGVITSWNPGAERLYGYSAEEAIGQPSTILTPPERAREEAEMLQRVLGGTRIDQYETERIKKGGGRIEVSLSLSPIRDNGGSVLGVSAIERDISDRRRVFEAEARFKSSFDDAPIGMALVSIEPESLGQFLQVNQAFCDLVGYSQAELEATNFQALTHPEDLGKDLALMTQLLADELPSYEIEKRYVHAARDVLSVLVTASLVRDASGKSLYCIRQIQDIQERKKFEGHLEHLADHDALTGLFNRRRFSRELSRQMSFAGRYGGGGAVLLLDIDNFKDVNDTLGHNTGDEVITGVAHLLRERLRDTDILARLGGDEFAVLLPNTSEDEAKAVAGDLMATVTRKPVLGAERRTRITLSIGIALFEPGKDMTADDLLIDADLAMYDAKEAGRDRFAFSTDEQQARTEARLTWTDRIRQALEEDLFVLHCQPILDLHSNEVSQHELLLRMRGTGGELVLPATFIYTAERFGLIGAIDRWVVGRAVQLIADERGAGRELRLEVNVSGHSVVDAELPDFIEQELNAASVEPANLIVEVTETAAIANMEQARKFVARLADIGCSFALDDFGAGFGSFYYLKYLPLDFLKIDGEFIRHLPASTTDQLILRSIVQMAQGLSKKTIAEFVGDRACLDVLREVGVDYAQGYQVARPRPLSELWAPVQMN